MTAPQHNLSNFDGVFLMKYIINLNFNNNFILIKPTIKDGNFIFIDLIFKDIKIVLEINY
jgi:hypothetical protein